MDEERTKGREQQCRAVFKTVRRGTRVVRVVVCVSSSQTAADGAADAGAPPLVQGASKKNTYRLSEPNLIRHCFTSGAACDFEDMLYMKGESYERA